MADAEAQSPEIGPEVRDQVAQAVVAAVAAAFLSRATPTAGRVRRARPGSLPAAIL
jgi:hypothetical protein